MVFQLFHTGTCRTAPAPVSQVQVLSRVRGTGTKNAVFHPDPLSLLCFRNPIIRLPLCQAGIPLPSCHQAVLPDTSHTIRQ